MDTKFQTSFIPKKPLLADQKVTSHHQGMSVFMFVSVLLFIISSAGAVYSVLWKDVLMKSQEGYKVELEKAEAKFNPKVIEDLRRVNAKLNMANKMLKDHLAVSEIFSIISGLTIDGVVFKSFEFSEPSKDSDGIKLSLRGYGNSYSSIAFQSSVFSQSEKYGTNKIIKDPFITNLALDEKGNVNFTFTATVDPSYISHEKLLTGPIQ